MRPLNIAEMSAIYYGCRYHKLSHMDWTIIIMISMIIIKFNNGIVFSIAQKETS